MLPESLANEYIEESEILKKRIDSLKGKLKSESLSATQKFSIRKRISILETMYSETRGTGKYLLREIENEKRRANRSVL